MRKIAITAALLLTASGCGVPQQAGLLAQREAALTVPPSDEEVRAELLRQADQWTQLDALMHQHELGGVRVNAQFQAAVSRTADLARRQKTLIQTGQDEPTQNAAVLEQFHLLWNEAATGLRP